MNIWDGKQAELIPACRVEPSSAEEVTVILRTLIDEQCHFTVKSGGHSRIQNSSNAEHGVTIDMVRFKDLLVADDTETVKIGVGWTWAKVFAAVEAEGLHILGGRQPTVGVGGLVMGGESRYTISFHVPPCSGKIYLILKLLDRDGKSSHRVGYRALRRLTML